MADQKGKKQEQPLGWKKNTVLYLHDLLYMMIAIMVLFLLVFRVIVVSGSSMYDTLIDGDYLLLLSNQLSSISHIFTSLIPFPPAAPM